MTGEQPTEWRELRARPVRNSTESWAHTAVDLLRHDARLVRMNPEEALAIGAALCEAARQAIFDRDELPVVPLQDEPSGDRP